MGRCNCQKKIKICPDCTLIAKSIKAKSITAKNIEVNTLNVNTINGYPVLPPTVSSQGFHPIQTTELNSKDPLPTFKPFDVSGVEEHIVSFPVKKLPLKFNSSSDTDVLLGLFTDVKYMPTIRNTSDKCININFSTYLIISYDLCIDAVNTCIKEEMQSPVTDEFKSRWFYPNNTEVPGFDFLPFSFGAFIGAFISYQPENEQGSPSISFNVKPSDTLISPPGINKLFFNKIINNGFFPIVLSLRDENGSPEFSKALFYDNNTGKLGGWVDDNTPSQVFPIIGNYECNLVVNKVVMEMELEDKNDAEFLSIKTGGDSDPENPDHIITYKQTRYPIKKLV